MHGVAYVVIMTAINDTEGADAQLIAEGFRARYETLMELAPIDNEPDHFSTWVQQMDQLIAEVDASAVPKHLIFR